MAQLEELVGVEAPLDRVSSTLQEFARGLGAPVVGGYHVSCSDESEWECSEAFQRSFAQLVLPALKLGSFGGRSAAPSLVDRAVAALGGAEAPDLVVDGRFIGGYITRHYGRPDEGRHALQLEMAQRVYMQEEPPRRRPDAMAATARRLRGLVQALLEWRPGD